MVWCLLLLPLLSLGACDAFRGRQSNDPEESFEIDDCSIPTGRLVSATLKDAIPALTNPPLTTATSDESSYVGGDDRVIGLQSRDSPLAIPLNILWHHEIVNVNHDAYGPIAVTHCPLTGSSLAFERDEVHGAEFGVSGLLLNNNLVMYDGGDRQSLWPQMSREAKCGAQSGESLDMIPVVEMTWQRWRTLHPNTQVPASDTGYEYNYRASGYPYGDYRTIDNERLLYDMPVDTRRPPKERVLGIPGGGRSSIALPFGALDSTKSVRVVQVAIGGQTCTVFWNREADGAMAFKTSLSFSTRDDRILDDETESVWSIDGRAIQGPRKGDQLTPVAEAHTAFWFAWAAFHPETEIWTSSSTGD